MYMRINIVVQRKTHPPALHFKAGRTRELVVSAGESVEVTLPRNEVELNAFVIPTPPEGKKTSMMKIPDYSPPLHSTQPIIREWLI